MAPRSPEISVRQPWARVSAPVHETENHLNSPQRRDSGFSLYFRSEDLTGDIYPFKCRLLPPRPCRHLCEPPRWRRCLAQALRAPGRPPPPHYAVGQRSRPSSSDEKLRCSPTGAEGRQGFNPNESHAKRCSSAVIFFLDNASICFVSKQYKCISLKKLPFFQLILLPPPKQM